MHSLADAVRRTAAGERLIDPDLQQGAVMELGRSARKARESSEIDALLTQREREILDHLSQGLTMHQIGTRLGISPRTVETHVAKLYRKLGVRTRVQAVSRAVSPSAATTRTSRSRSVSLTSASRRRSRPCAM